MRPRLALVGIVALSLSGCATFQGGSSWSEVIAQAQSIAERTCGFVPTASTLAGILGLGDPTVQTAFALAQAVCSTVVRTKSNKFGGPVRLPGVSYRGVPIHGTWRR